MIQLAQFTTTPLMGGGVLVEGTDDTGTYGKTILMSDRWEMVKHARAHKQASAAFDEAVTEFFKPITDVADELKASLSDPSEHWRKVVINDGVEGEKPEVIDLDMDGVILRLLEESDGSLLRWISDTLVAVAAP